MPKQQHQPAGATPFVPSRSRRAYLPALLGAVLIAALALAAYWPSLHGGFIWDDELLLSDNDLIMASNGPLLFWFTNYAPDYWPMTNTSFWLEWRLWGRQSTGYHVTNLLLHIASAILIWMILRKLAIPGAFLAALLFTVHPVNVESVAWIAQRKNTLAMFFFLLSILWYLREVELQRRADNGQTTSRWYWLSLMAFILAMLSKGSVALLPPLLLGLQWWLRRKITRWDLARVAPFFLVAVVLTGVNIWFQARAAETALNISFAQRLLGAGAVVWFYLSKALAPIDLVFIYPHWDIRPAEILWWLPLAATLVLSGVLIWQRDSRQAHWARPLLFAWGFFCLALLPVLGFVDVGFMQFSQVADHYQHLALIGVAAAAAAAWSRWRQAAHGPIRQAACVSAVAAVAGLTLLSWEQSALYTDAVTSYQATLRKNPECWVAHNNLGDQFVKAGRTQEALPHFEQALRLKPDYAEAHFNLGNLARTSDPDKAIDQFRQALRIRPSYAAAHNNLATVLVESGQLGDGIEHYQLALRYRPRYAEAYNNLGVALVGSGQMAEALERFQQALQLDPNSADAHHNFGVALVYFGNLPAAVVEFEESLRLQPTRLQTYSKLTAAYAQLREPAKAIATAEKALQVARSSGQTEMVEKIEPWLKAYRAQQANALDADSVLKSFPPAK